MTEIEMECSSGNVFTDLGLQESEVMAMKSDIVGMRAHIEQLERELVEWKAREGSTANSFMQAQADLKDARDQLAAEKVLADRLYEEGVTSSRWDLPSYAAYRKARGL